MTKKNLRQIRYNVETTTDEQTTFRHKWIFCMVNRPREIERIRQRSLQALATCGEYHKIIEGLIPKTRGLHYLAYILLANKGQLSEVEWKHIYRADDKIKHDRDLDGRRREKWFEEVYIPRLVEQS